MSARRLVVVLWLAAFGAFGAVGFGLHKLWTTPPEVLRMSAPEANGTLTVTWLGDVMLGDAAQPYLARHGYDWPFRRVRHLLHADVVVANAESPITARTEPFDPAQHWHYHSLPAAATAYANAGIDVLGLANNHAMDRGPAGLADTQRSARAAGLLTVGAGPDVTEAEKPLLIEGEAGTVGVVALGKYYGRTKMATPDQPGTVALSRAAIRRGYDLARRAGADFVVGFVHWGRSYSSVTPEQVQFAREFADAGYDLVVGHHPHVPQPVRIVAGMPVLFSVGNFVFGAPGRFTPELPGFGLVATTRFSRSGLTELILRCVVTDNEVVEYRPRPCTPAEAARVMRPLHKQIELDRTVARLPLRTEPALP